MLFSVCLNAGTFTLWDAKTYFICFFLFAILRWLAFCASLTDIFSPPISYQRPLLKNIVKLQHIVHLYLWGMPIE